MKIERLNDNQIRCTLTRSDLAERQLKISELTSGSDKVRAFFQEIMQQAYREYGFETDNTPLMIEASPVSPDTLVVIVTRVSNPEELDNRFHRFGGHPEDDGTQEPDPEEGDELFDPLPVGGQADLELPDSMNADPAAAGDGEDNLLPALEQLMSLFASAARQKMSAEEGRKDSGTAAKAKAASAGKVGKAEKKTEQKEVPARVFIFPDMKALTRLCAMIEPFYPGESSLYRDPVEEDYFLVLKRPAEHTSLFDRACRIACDFSIQIPYLETQEVYFKEHFTPIVPEDAVATLGSLV